MGIKFNERLNSYTITYHRRHPVTKVSINIRRQGIKTKAEAEKVYKALIIKMCVKFNENPHPFWPEMVAKFLEYYANCGNAKNTVKNYKHCIEANTFTIWSNKRINEFSTGEIRDFIQEDLGKFSEAHRKSMLKILRAVFRYAVEQNIIHRDPCPKLKFRKNEKIKKMLTEDEIRILLSRARAENNEWFPVWALACYTGLRNGELYALKWESVDFKKRLIYITHSWNKINGLKETKSGDDRVVEIAPSLLPILIELKEKTSDEFILPRIRDWETGTQAKPLKKYLKELNLPLIRFHDLRASWATIMLSKGIEPIKIMSMGGWKDLKTMQIYIRKSGINIQGITDKLAFL
jgi:integrase